VTEELISKETLQNKLNAIKEVITKRQWLYYHIVALQNFIYHLDNILSERTRARTAKSIYEYLSMLEERIKEDHDLTALAKGLAPYVWQISHVHRDELGFISRPYYPINIVIWAIIFFILNYSFSTVFALATVAIVATIRIVYQQIKVKAKKVY